MKFKSYFEMDKELDRLYVEEKYNDMIELLDNAEKVLPKSEYEKYNFQINFNRGRFRTNCKLYSESMEILKALINEGFSCPLHWERFKPLYDLKDFEELKSKNDILIAKEQSESKIDYIVHLPKGYDGSKKYPLFLALHGGGENIDILSWYIKPDILLDRDFIFVYVQSSQVSYHGCYEWLANPSTAQSDIKKCYELLLKQYSVDEGRVIIGGFSAGAITSIDVTMANIIPLRGFIAISPEIKPESFTEKSVTASKAKGVKGAFMEGELVLPIEDEDRMMAVFNEVNFPYQYYINKGIGHAIPDDIQDKLRKAIDFILQ